MSNFDTAFAVVVGVEGVLSLDPRDPGNWTGGAVGAGELRGTKYGVSAAAHPTVDIRSLTLDGAREIYRNEYWTAVRADELPPPLALLVFDAAVNSGPGQAIRWLQQAVGTGIDGKLGPKTMAAVQAHAGQGARVMAELLARRLVFMASLPIWRINSLGWARRVCLLPWLTAEMK